MDERWEQSGSTILASGMAWVCIMAEPHHSQCRPIGIASPEWDEAMKRARLIVKAPKLLAALENVLGIAATSEEVTADEDMGQIYRVTRDVLKDLNDEQGG